MRRDISASPGCHGAVRGVTLVFVLSRGNLVAMMAVHYVIDLAIAFMVALLPSLRG